MRCVVTGGAGFIGSHIVDELVSRDHNVTVLDDLSAGVEENLNPEVRFMNLDIRDAGLVRTALVGAEFVFLCAAQISVPRSIENPQETLDINVKGTENVIEAAKDAKKIIFSSSTAVYGDNPHLPLDEKAELRPKSPYAESKISAEKLLEDSGIPFVVFRYFNVFGPRQRPGSAYAAAIPTFVSQALQGRDIQIFGDGLQTRDFVHVHDVVRANIKAMSMGHGIFNVCSGEETTVNRLVDTILKLTDSSSTVRHVQEREGDIKHSLGGNSKARQELKWQPLVGLATGLKEYIDFLKHNKA
jgi:UDP-glucose 4-epimerase